MKSLTFSILCFASIVFAFKTIADDQTRSQEQFETAENRAAQTYQTSPKGSLSGQVFVASKGGENFKLGAVQISLFARDAIDHLLAGLRVLRDAKIGQLRFDIATATAVEE